MSMIQFVAKNTQAASGIGDQHRLVIRSMRIVATRAHERPLGAWVGGLVAHRMIVSLDNALMASDA